jgi:hypothetical protein
MTASRRSSSDWGLVSPTPAVERRDVFQVVLEFVVGDFASSDLPSCADQQRERRTHEDDLDSTHDDIPR